MVRFTINAGPVAQRLEQGIRCLIRSGMIRASKDSAKISRNNFTTDRTDKTDARMRLELVLSESRSRYAESGFVF